MFGKSKIEKAEAALAEARKTYRPQTVDEVLAECRAKAGEPTLPENVAFSAPWFDSLNANWAAENW